MKNNVLEYKGYHTKIEYSAEEMLLRGKIDGIDDLVNFESDSAEKIVEEFHLAVDDYLEFCKDVGKEPDKEYSGTFNVRIKPELHRKLSLLASKNGDTLNATVEKVINYYFSDSSKINVGNVNVTIKLSEPPQKDSFYRYDGKTAYQSGNVISFNSKETKYYKEI